MCWICWNLNVQVKMFTAKAPQHVVLYSSPGWNHCGRKLFHQQVQRIIVLFSSFVFFLFSKKIPTLMWNYISLRTMTEVFCISRQCAFMTSQLWGGGGGYYICYIFI